ncbi:MAG: vitamin K epoxide reductase family protein [Patescibacteria group bacterium]
MATPSRWYPTTVLAIAFLGFLDAVYLTIEHFTSFSLPCSITHGCEVVTNSVYSEILGIPVALLGALYYVAVLLGTYALLEFGRRDLLKWVAVATTAGFLFSAWFVYVQLFVIKAICQYCILSAFTSTILFIVSMIYVWKIKTSASSPLPVATPEE